MLVQNMWVQNMLPREVHMGKRMNVQNRLALLQLPRSASLERSYNLFRRKHERDLYCAVPEDCPVPVFIDGEQWEYAMTVIGPRGTPLGFKQAAALSGCSNNGFYLFYAHGRYPH